jgi:hypothetical protein
MRTFGPLLRTATAALLVLASCHLVLGIEDPKLGSFDGGQDIADASGSDPNDAAPADACVAISETCNGADDDCDGDVDEGFPGTNVPCDGADSDACQEGVVVCNAAGNMLVCNDATDDIAELCNAVDDDCDTVSDEGFNVGMPCDGGDDDLCALGAFVCTVDQKGNQCNEPGPGRVELCNGEDDDCDGTINEGFGLGTPCDSAADTDLCTDGMRVCDGTMATTCNDGLPNKVEICNGADDDCDGSTDEGTLCATGQRCTGAGGCQCDSVSCPNGCCTADRQCHIDEFDNCGTGGGSCAPCQGNAVDTCDNGQCVCGSTGGGCGGSFSQCCAGQCEPPGCF